MPIQAISRCIALLDSAIYDEGVKLFGHVPIRSAQPQSTKQNRIIKLVALKNSLVEQLKASKSETDLEGLQVLLKDAKNQLRLARRKENSRKKRWLKNRARKAFKSDPFKAGKDVLHQRSSVQLSVSQEELDSYRLET